MVLRRKRGEEEVLERRVRCGYVVFDSRDLPADRDGTDEECDHYQVVLSSLVRHGTASGSYLIAYSLLQHENHHLVKTFFSLNRKATNQ